MDLDKFDNQVLLLDGGFSNELEKFVTFDVHKEPLWTAKALHTDENSIIKTHLKYLEAGADLVETSTYQASVVGFRKYLSLDETLAEELMLNSVTLANKAVKEFLQTENQDRRHPLVVGSIGPYGAHLCDGSEYRGNYIDTVEPEKIIELHLPRIRALIKGGAQLLAIETMPSLKEVELLLDLLKKEFPETKTMVSFSVKEKDSSLTAHGDSITEAFQIVAKYPQVWGFGINCCSPTLISPFLTEMSKFRNQNPNVGSSIRLVVYPNTGQDWIAGKGWIKDPVPTLDTYVQEWMELGATVVGGCCQVGADEIKMMRPLIEQWNSNLKSKG